ncbi:short-chain dehydrogenase [Marivivens niveibacter]|uniref:Short-chain dehydrogenase n=1 Tax=Marivivens niveibacter TaxID=1930667 RepID=A0A251WYQ6_9RHOB|nr:SDR family NAD(P)-dependent oxidoreductase [Marivivens niveibacter]OUD09502.1 short-chain dehydrogenase [Marivivens niveibacter]
MRDWNGKRYWLIGASEGLGRALAQVMSSAGVEVILSARDADRLTDLSNELIGKSRVVPLDVTDADAVKQAAKDIGPIDGMVYLAGVYWPMSAKEWDADQATAMADINFTGAMRAVGAVIPDMVAKGAGHIVLTGSLSGFRGLPGAIGYGASKAGVMYLAESMYADLRGSGVDVQLVNPGFIKTRLTDKNDFKMPFIKEPKDAAQDYFEHMNSDGFAHNFPRGFGAMFRLSQFLPDWLYYRLF